jgi:serine/threonine-protein kinase
MAAPLATVGRYALRHEIASGGMAVVHLGRLVGAAGFSRTVAIKRLHPHLARNPEFVAMFLDEARLAARIRHPNVVSTLDVVATEGELFVVMEYVPGDSLSRLLHFASQRGERVPVPVAASIMVNVLHGLHAAHEAIDEQGQPLCLVHRDVSPHNVLVGTDGLAHLIDFGVAKAIGRAQVTREGQLKGKLPYMAPEQLSGGRVDRRADVFGASVVFWEMLTGQRLFDGADEGEIYGKVVRGEVRRPSKLVKAVDRKTDAIVLRGLARSAGRRYESARAMALAIETALPLATPSQVGQWVERLTGDLLAERRRQIAEIERDGEGAEGGTSIRLSRPADPAVNIATAPGGRLPFDEGSVSMTRPEGRAPRAEAMFTDTSLVASEPQVRRRPDRRSSLVGLGGVALVAAGVALGVMWLRGSPAGPAGATNIATGASMPAPAVTWVASTTSSPPAVDPVAPGAPPASISTAPAPPEVSPTDLPLAPAATAHPTFVPRIAVPRRAPGAACDPPYTIDANGYKKYKRECASL